MSDASTPAQDMPTKAESTPKSAEKGTLIPLPITAVVAVVAGLWSGAQELRQGFYAEIKNWSGIKDIRDERKAAYNEISSLKGMKFDDYIKRSNQIEVDFTKAVGKKLFETRGIHSEGWKGATIGTWQRWRASNHSKTRTEAILSFGKTAGIVIGAVLTLENRELLHRLLTGGSDLSEEKSRER